MPAHLEATLEAEELIKWVNRVNRKTKDAIQIKEKFAALLSAITFGDIVEHFAQEQGPDGKWARRSYKYEQYLNKIGRGGNKILQFSGRLRQSFDKSGNTAETGHKVRGSDIGWYNRVEYAWWHDEGAPVTRPFMWLSDKAVEKMTDQTLTFILDEGL